MDGDSSLIGGSNKTRVSRPKVLLALAVAGALLTVVSAVVVIWFFFGRRPATEAGESPPPDPAVEKPAVNARAAPRPSVAAPRAAQRQGASPYGEYDLPIMGPGPDDRPDGPAHPHPITPEHIKIHHENFLIAALYDALDARNFVAMRRLVQEYRDQHPDDANKMREGFEVMADCLEKPGADTRAAAQRYYDQERASTLRRLVRRNCLEARPD